jgi:hypothetical protein
MVVRMDTDQPQAATVPAEPEPAAVRDTRSVQERIADRVQRRLADEAAAPGHISAVHAASIPS